MLHADRTNPDDAITLTHTSIRRLALCEANKVYLVPGALYVFEEVQGCPSCRAEAINSEDANSTTIEGVHDNV